MTKYSYTFKKRSDFLDWKKVLKTIVLKFYFL